MISWGSTGGRGVVWNEIRSDEMEWDGMEWDGLKVNMGVGFTCFLVR